MLTILNRFTHHFSLLFIFLFAGMGTFTGQELRAPAYPIATHNPYMSIWSMGDELNSSATKHWTGEEHSLTGIIEVDGEFYRFLGLELKEYKTLVPTSDEAEYSVQYSEATPASNWYTLGFDDALWKTGIAPFSDDSNAKTRWETEDLWFRRSFDLDEINLKNLYLKLRHDDNITVFLNGEKIYAFNGWKHSYKFIPIEKEVIEKLKKENNILAIHIKNSAGGRYLDAGFVTEASSMENITIHQADQTDVTLNATQTIYNFDCGKVQVEATFTSPLLMDDLEVFSRPVTYLSVKVKSKDHLVHDVQVYLGASSSLAVNSPAQEVEAINYRAKDLNILRVGTTEQPVLEKKGDNVRIDWGYAYIAAPPSTIQYISPANEAITGFVSDRRSSTEKLVGKNLALNTIADFGSVGRKEQEKVFLLGYDELFSVQYFDAKLEPWWKKDGNTMEEVLSEASMGYSSIIKKTQAFDQKLYKDASLAGGKKYADLCELAYRQAVAAHTLLEGPKGEILFLSKENHSNGSINTVDVTYPSAPLFLIYNPDLMKGMLNGIFHYSESGRWEKPFPAHDLGTYPIATGQTYGEDMPVEEAGNMIILTAAIAMQEGNAGYASEHWPTLTIWANYLLESGFDPANQLSTDDFAGHLARNSNLSVKAIMAIAAYGKLAGILGDNKTEKIYNSAAKRMAEEWMKLADDGDHYSLAFEKENTWSQKYNLVWDEILGLNIFPDSVPRKEILYYLTKQNEYGLPLDSRKSYTKSDWVLWTATLAENQNQFEELIAPIWKYADETEDRVPISDWHETKNAKVMNFKARSVVGGYFIKLLKWKVLNKKN